MAAYLFNVATGLGHAVRCCIEPGRVEMLRRLLVVDPVIATIFGLTYTGYVVVLFPLSYLNHVLIGKAWDQVGLSAREIVGGP